MWCWIVEDMDTGITIGIYTYKNVLKAHMKDGTLPKNVTVRRCRMNKYLEIGDFKHVTGEF